MPRYVFRLYWGRSTVTFFLGDHNRLHLKGQDFWNSSEHLERVQNFSKLDSWTPTLSSTVQLSQREFSSLPLPPVVMCVCVCVCYTCAGYTLMHILFLKYTVNRNPHIICSVVITEYIECHYKSVRHRVLESYMQL